MHSFSHIWKPKLYTIVSLLTIVGITGSSSLWGLVAVAEVEERLDCQHANMNARNAHLNFKGRSIIDG